MKTVRTAESSYRRQQLAQLLRTVRSIRHGELSPEQKLERLNAAAAAAGDVIRFVRIDAAQSAVTGNDASLRFVLDKPMLSEAETADMLQPASSR